MFNAMFKLSWARAQKKKIASARAHKLAYMGHWQHNAALGAPSAALCCQWPIYANLWARALAILSFWARAHGSQNNARLNEIRPDYTRLD